MILLYLTQILTNRILLWLLTEFKSINKPQINNLNQFRPWDLFLFLFHDALMPSYSFLVENHARAGVQTFGKFRWARPSAESDEDSEAILLVRWAGAWSACYGRGAKQCFWQQFGGTKAGDGRNYWKHDLEEEAGSESHKCKYLTLFWVGVDQVLTQTGLQGSRPQLTQPEGSALGGQPVWTVGQCNGHTHGALVPPSLGDLCISWSSFVRPVSSYP